MQDGETPVSGKEGFASDAKDEFNKLMKSKGIYISSHASLRVMLTYAELHNGTGYVDNNHIDPYLYSGTNIYVKGKYVDVKRPDGSSYSVYEKDVVDEQVGVYALLMSIDKEDWYLYDEKIKFYNN